MKPVLITSSKIYTEETYKTVQVYFYNNDYYIFLSKNEPANDFYFSPIEFVHTAYIIIGRDGKFKKDRFGDGLENHLLKETFDFINCHRTLNE